MVVCRLFSTYAEIDVFDLRTADDDVMTFLAMSAFLNVFSRLARPLLMGFDVLMSSSVVSLCIFRHIVIVPLT